MGDKLEIRFYHGRSPPQKGSSLVLWWETILRDAMPTQTPIVLAIFRQVARL
jgi:hypothetical protein